MGIKDLPSVGANFKASSFKPKFEAATGYGELKSLGNNPKTRQAIIGAVAKYQGKIRSGGFSRLLKTAVLSKIKASDKTLTSTDKNVVRKIFEHFGRGAAVKEKKPIKAETPVKVSDGGSHSADSRRRSMARDRLAIGQRPRQANISVLNRLRKENMGAKASGFSLSAKSTGFASDPEKGDKSPGQPPSPEPLKGSRPIDI